MRGRPNTWRSWLITGIMGALGAVAFSYWFDHGTTTAASMADTPAPTVAETQSSVGFTSERHLDEHYEKHGAEFGNITKQDYLRQAQLLRDAKGGGPVLETVRADKVTTRYDRETGAFIAFNPNGTIRTFFKPNDGERYYRRQASRVGE